MAEERGLSLPCSDCRVLRELTHLVTFEFGKIHSMLHKSLFYFSSVVNGEPPEMFFPLQFYFCNKLLFLHLAEFPIAGWRIFYRWVGLRQVVDAVIH